MNSIKWGLVGVFAAWCLSGAVAIAEPLSLGMTWLGDSAMANRVDGAFREKIAELVPDVDIELQLVPDIDDLETFGSVIARFEREKDGIVVLRSNGARWLGTHPPAIPTFIGAANNPIILGVVENMEAPEGNITGVTYYLPLDVQFDIFQAILPNLDSVFLLMEQGHASTQVDRAGTQAICQERGLTYGEVICATEAQCLAAVRANQGKVGAFIIGGNALNMDNAANIAQAAGDTPVLAYTAAPVQNGALGGFVADDVILGHLLAESVVDVFVNGKPIREVPIKMDPKPKFILNVTTAERLGIEIPYSIIQAATIVE